MPNKRPFSKPQAGLRNLLGELRGLIQAARQQAVRAVDQVQVQTCWQVGRHIVEFEQGGKGRAAYGAGLLAGLAEALTTEFGRSFDESTESEDIPHRSWGSARFHRCGRRTMV